MSTPLLFTIGKVKLDHYGICAAFDWQRKLGKVHYRRFFRLFDRQHKGFSGVASGPFVLKSKYFFLKIVCITSKYQQCRKY